MNWRVEDLVVKNTKGSAMKILGIGLTLLLSALTVPAQAAFTVNANGTVSDSATGLVWDRCTWGQTGADCSGGVAGAFTWANALGVAVTANAATHKGFNDWRLPNMNELESLVHVAASAAPTIDGTAFPNTVAGMYWTSTIAVNNTVYAGAVFFNSGEVDYNNGSNVVRLVRSGQDFDITVTYTVNLAVDPVAGGSASCLPSPVIQTATSICTATPNAGYSFSHWSGDCSGASCVLTNVTANKNVTAHFTAPTHAINVGINPPGTGTASCAPNPVPHGADSLCTATPNAGYSFTGWSSDCSGLTCNLTNVTTAKTVNANFAPIATHAILVGINLAGAGTASCSPNPVPHGGDSACTATANPGYTFTGWSSECSGMTCNLTNVTTTKTVNANFALASSYTIATAASPPGSGTVNCAPNPVSSGGSSTCTATPNAGYSFSAWSGDCTGASCVLNNVTSAKSVTASFVLNSYAITTTVNPAGGGTGSCLPNPVNHGASSTCTATPNAGYSFSGWSGDCAGASCALNNVTSAKNVTASFVANQSYTSPSATGSGSITASFTGGGSTCTYTTAQFIPLSGHPASPPAGSAPTGVNFPHGLFDFVLANCTPGSTVTVTITYPSALPANTQYWKYGPTAATPAPHWYVLPATLGGNSATFSITDGGLGDDDLTANGSIVDQGGPGNNNIGAIPTLSGWGLAALSALLAVLGLTLRRRMF